MLKDSVKETTTIMLKLFASRECGKEIREQIHVLQKLKYITGPNVICQNKQDPSEFR